MALTSNMKLQATLAASSCIATTPIFPHHPITCTGDLQYSEDDSLQCEHAKTKPKDQRTKYCVDHSIAILLIEEAVRLYG